MSKLPITNDDQYTSLRNCTSGITNVKFIDRMGLNKDPFKCADEILWFERDVDFNLIDFAQGEIAVEREDVSSNLALKQTEGNLLTWSKSFPIQAKEGSRLQQFILEIMMNEKSSDRDGQGILAYSNGGIHYERTIIYNEGESDEFIVKMVFLNLKTENWPDVFSGDITTETTYEWSILVENWPHYFVSGKAPLGWSLPQELTPVEVGYDSYNVEGDLLTITNVNVIDPDLIALDDTVIVCVYDGYELIDMQAVTSGNDYTLTHTFVNESNFVLSYPLSESINITGCSVEIVPTPPTATIDGVIPLVAGEANFVYSYDSGSDDASLSKVEIVETAAPTITVDSITPAVEGIGTPAQFTGLTATVEYTVRVVQNGTELASYAFTAI